jgi:Golgi SNAP receptor complex protein 2
MVKVVQAYTVSPISSEAQAELVAYMGSDLMLGGITTTLGALSRLIDDYDSMAKKEMVTAAREKANT